MSDSVDIGVTILWASELFAASHCLHTAFDAMKANPFNEEAMQAACKEALKAAYVALHGIYERPNNHVLVCNAERSKFVIRDTTVVKEKKRKKRQGNLFDAT